MRIFPAIDISGSKCVRLTQGDFNQKKVYYDNPLDAAKFWESQGAKDIHIVDLDGSLNGEFVNLSNLKEIAKETALNIQFGGGIRSLKDVETLVACGVNRIVIGSLALKDFDTFKDILERYKSQIVCAIDFKNDYVMTEGWQQESKTSLNTFIKTISEIGCQSLLVTNISRDGMLTGPDINTYKSIKNLTTAEIIASGGVSSLEDLKILKSIGVPSVIIGKAFYEQKFTFSEAVQAVGGPLC
ncbi:1-(5-phosphoribosyl)-5-[(5-phosphoribosylamino)methylideneamino]imidazole-4-carboxamide isomerase [Fusibacter sp. 3D3]|uniref:1-(5-phosphoribosyl)-5-[(5- phosphoribosylamino)methylideneamino]imidazole-4- carboxamide isomerase n=1 Tax=Fusibacter sp. 3D3 TaxID=1048380 RepID=UPI000853ADEF|nr:1-(5-phosphoribosyl)-5-[(5-phosphoribosylamino)methylideneamino]imidazole-4-carboxamide isomerase [Fusibacter sp. 3D3]GAU77919.1 phosphoribosylformimino-5-aminoimidazole carboxamide ribotide isomerase [Fusibacter sp. 3D3]